MYIKAIRCINHGPISDLSLEATFSPESGAPDPIILVGPNGSGKSLILSSILDCMVELKRRAYHEAPEVIVDEMLRMQSRDYISPNSSFSYVHIVVTHAEREATYTDFVSNITGPSLIEYINQNPLPALNLSNPLWTSDGFFKDVASDTQFLDDFRSSLYLYFPFFRYEHPAWLNPQAPIEFALRSPLHKISTE